MSVAPPLRDRRAERYTATRREILDAAWELVRAGGLASLTMRDLGTRVGMRAQSLYAYFPAKYAISAAMDVLDTASTALRACGIGDARALDVWTAVIGGIAAQQNANEPGGDRWVRLTDEITDMFLAHFRRAKDAKNRGQK